MPNGTRRGGQYRTRSGGTAYRRGAKIAPRTKQLGLGGTDLAGIGWFLGSCEVVLSICWVGCRWTWRGCARLWQAMDAAEQRAAAPAEKERPLSPLVFELQEDTPNGWHRGDVQCKVHHSNRVAKCKGCTTAASEQRARRPQRASS
jgi:hypothetical protein